MGKYLILAGIALIAGLVIHNQIQFKKAEAAYPPNGSFVAVEGINLHYIRKGEGMPVVFLHGGILTANDFAEVVELASSRGYQAIAFDRPGYGYSERPGDAGRSSPSPAWRFAAAGSGEADYCRALLERAFGVDLCASISG